MGICSSCLGFRRGEASNPETARLLHDDPYRGQYGTNGQQRQSNQPNPEAQRREREALEGICHSMSDEVIDVFTVLPRAESGAASEAGKGRRDGNRPGTPDSSNGRYKPSPVSLKQYKIDEEVTVPQELAYRSVRKLPKDQSQGDVTREEDNWAAAKAVMG